MRPFLARVMRYGERDVSKEPRDEKGRWTTGGPQGNEQVETFLRDATTSNSLRTVLQRLRDLHPYEFAYALSQNIKLVEEPHTWQNWDSPLRWDGAELKVRAGTSDFKVLSYLARSMNREPGYKEWLDKQLESGNLPTFHDPGNLWPAGAVGAALKQQHDIEQSYRFMEAAGATPGEVAARKWAMGLNDWWGPGGNAEIALGCVAGMARPNLRPQQADSASGVSAREYASGAPLVPRPGSNSYVLPESQPSAASKRWPPEFGGPSRKFPGSRPPVEPPNRVDKPPEPLPSNLLPEKVPPKPSSRSAIQPKASKSSTATHERWRGPLARQLAIHDAMKRAGFSKDKNDTNVRRICDPITKELIGEETLDGQRYWRINGDYVEWKNVESSDQVPLANPRLTDQRSNDAVKPAMKPQPHLPERPLQKRSSGTNERDSRNSGQSQPGTPVEPTVNQSRSPSRSDSADHSVLVNGVAINIPKAGCMHPLLSARKSERAPTHGIFNDEKTRMKSGDFDANSFNFFGPIRHHLSDDAQIALEHVEGHAVVKMINKNLNEAVLHITHESGPCPYCVDGIRELLQEGQKLWVVFPKGSGYFTKSEGWVPQ